MKPKQNTKNIDQDPITQGPKGCKHLVVGNLQLKSLQAFKAYWHFHDYQMPIASSQGKFGIVKDGPNMIIQNPSDYKS
jgi:hypothetical protein